MTESREDRIAGIRARWQPLGKEDLISVQDIAFLLGTLDVLTEENGRLKTAVEGRIFGLTDKLDAAQVLAVGNAEDASFWKEKAETAEIRVDRLRKALDDIQEFANSQYERYYENAQETELGGQDREHEEAMAGLTRWVKVMNISTVALAGEAENG